MMQGVTKKQRCDPETTLCQVPIDTSSVNGHSVSGTGSTLPKAEKTNTQPLLPRQAS
jgi:hypothetical protein